MLRTKATVTECPTLVAEDRLTLFSFLLDPIRGLSQAVFLLFERALQKILLPKRTQSYT